MINITKSGNSVLIESSDNSQFPWANGSLSVPFNTMTYVLEDNNDYIVFKSIEDGKTLFAAFINEITFDGTQATRDTFIEEFDKIANASASSGDGSSADVDLSDYYTKSEVDSAIANVTVEETDPIFTHWRENTVNVKIGTETSVADSQSVCIGNDSLATRYSVAIGHGAANRDVESVAIGEIVEAKRQAVSIGYENVANGYGVTIGAYNETKNEAEVIIGWGGMSRSGATSAATQFVIADSYKGLQEDQPNMYNSFEIRQNNDIYCWYNNSFIKLQDYLNNEWTGTQSQYDALGTYSDNITYNIIEG